MSCISSSSSWIVGALRQRSAVLHYSYSLRRAGGWAGGRDKSKLNRADGHMRRVIITSAEYTIQFRLDIQIQDIKLRTYLRHETLHRTLCSKYSEYLSMPIVNCKWQVATVALCNTSRVFYIVRVECSTLDNSLIEHTICVLYSCTVQ